MQANSCFPLGIWTDGTWSFSTGLDQRVRCWKMGLAGQFTEYSHAIISVPEPETLDVFHDRWASLWRCVFTPLFYVSDSGDACLARAKRKYHIAVAGRGMQMVEFSPPEDDWLQWLQPLLWMSHGCWFCSACVDHVVLYWDGLCFF